MLTKLGSMTAILAIAAVVSPLASEEPATHSAFRFAGYLPDYRASTFDPLAARDLTDLIVFSARATESGSIDLSRLQQIPWAKLRAFKTRHCVRLWLCIGGWERSRELASVAASGEKRQRLVEDAVRICLAERLDGLDLDWEHPRNETEQTHYAKLLAELHQAFQPHGLMLSVTLAAWQKLPRATWESVDWINLMAYDHPGPHSTFEDARKDVEKLLAAGAPAHKITLGLPFYGRDRAQANKSLTYREILAQHRPTPTTDEIGTLSFNGRATIQKKTRYALDHHLGGVMVWELGQDALGKESLVQVIADTIHAQSHK